MADYEDGDPDEAPRLAYWMPDQAVKNLTMEKTLHGHESHKQLARRLLDEALPLATMAITHIALNDPKSEMRYNASKYILEQTIGSPGKTSEVPTAGHAWDAIHEAVLIDKPGM